jgi:membrane-associated PAP2 superfamily phosphatase
MNAAAPVSVSASLWRRDLRITGIALLALLAWDASGLDLVAARWWGTAQGFAWRNHWLTSGVLHEGGRALAWVLLGGLLLNVWRPWLGGATRGARGRTVGLTLIGVLLVPALKRISQTSCPYDLSEFGGVASYVSHWRFGVFDGGPGHCYPSGHAVAAFAFFSIWFLLRGERPLAARRWLIGVLCVGAAFGLAQLARGAHYPSHTMWSAWWCWCVCAVGDAWARRGR